MIRRLFDVASWLRLRALCGMLAVIATCPLPGCGSPHGTPVQQQQSARLLATATTRPASSPSSRLAQSQPSPAEQLVAAVDNSQVTDWCYWRDWEGRLVCPPLAWYKLSGAARRVASLPWERHDPMHADCADLIPPLIRALNDPHKFVVAHLVLARWWASEWEIRTRYTPPDDSFGHEPDFDGKSYSERPDHAVLLNDDGLLVRLKQIGDDDDWIPDFYESERNPCTASIDPAQRNALRQRWVAREEKLIRWTPAWVKEMDEKGY
ncbi:MAG TPA: hypothetical protein VGI81_01005 [Tepidisphaeraceae bacterium]|jgi:hypothetical protein